ncbi:MULTISPECIES: hypothetical protein [Streptomyces]|uniref:hypothetical protein n=1 Tax=Streptomyces TaxID=1883 RepID=UPI000A366708|nr:MULTISPECIES: hypothetical protein [Streptomyces]MYR01099.1 hypothetical protein [Streptomyces sp. SID6139]MYR18563.1 hypothetical protein [Streptomyces sp. SID6137]
MSEETGGTPVPPTPAEVFDEDFDKRRLAREKRDERKVWYFLAYFLFGIHLVAFVMIYAVRHGK